MSSSKKQKINVLHVLSSAGIAGGERYLQDLIRYTDKMIQHAIILPYQGPFIKILENFNYNYTIIDMKKKFSIRSISSLVKYIKKNPVDILHTHGYRANFYGRIASMVTGIKSVSTVHVSLFDYTDTPFLIRYIYIMLERILSYRSSIFICISNAMKKDMLRLGIDRDRIVVINNGVDLERFYPRSPQEQMKMELGILGNGPLIGTVGRMVTEKGQVYLIEALRYLKNEWNDLKCLFIGEGPMLQQLKKMAFDLDVEKMCIFTGVKNNIELIYPLLTLFVLPSIREPFGLVLLEAMASGVTVLSTDSGGPSEFIEPGINGVLVPPRDSKSLASQVHWILSNKKKAEEIGQKGLRTVKTHFDVKGTARKIGEIYFSIYQSMNNSQKTWTSFNR
ncbi:MAG: glycosyltransferase family 4 protein [Thermodesulfobacteriota bacterium]|nr:glycosyltransferase family 4 protein [Thermodesulfobacteriota bacterium]